MNGPHVVDAAQLWLIIFIWPKRSKKKKKKNWLENWAAVRQELKSSLELDMIRIRTTMRRAARYISFLLVGWRQADSIGEKKVVKNNNIIIWI